ncbi:MAG: hypothetical protein ABL903_03670 [Methylococcales bacterium]
MSSKLLTLIVVETQNLASLRRDGCWRQFPQKHLNQLLLFSIGLMLPLVSQGEMRDPTQPLYPKAAVTAEPGKMIDDTPVLSAVWISPTSKRATLNGVTAKEGQTILNSIKIMCIRQNQVTIKQNNVTKTLQLVQRTTQPPLMLTDE